MDKDDRDTATPSNTNSYGNSVLKLCEWNVKSVLASQMTNITATLHTAPLFWLQNKTVQMWMLIMRRASKAFLRYQPVTMIERRPVSELQESVPGHGYRTLPARCWKARFNDYPCEKMRARYDPTGTTRVYFGRGLFPGADALGNINPRQKSEGSICFIDQQALRGDGTGQPEG